MTTEIRSSGAPQGAAMEAEADDARSIEANRALLETMYSAFANHDPGSMVTAYADNATFEDPAYGQLSAEQTRKMWSVLAKSKTLTVTYRVTPTEEGGVVEWQADYILNGHAVHNDVTSNITIVDGRIVEQRDTFDFAKWTAQATPGLVAFLAKHRVTAWLAHALVRSVAHKKVGI